MEYGYIVLDTLLGKVSFGNDKETAFKYAGFHSFKIIRENYLNGKVVSTKRII